MTVNRVGVHANGRAHLVREGPVSNRGGGASDILCASDNEAAAVPAPAVDDILLDGGREDDQGSDDSEGPGSRVPDDDADMPPQEPSLDDPRTYPFDSLAQGLLAMAFALTQVPHTTQTLIIACILTPGFDVEELRAVYSGDTMRVRVDSIIECIFRHTRTTEVEGRTGRQQKRKVGPDGTMCAGGHVVYRQDVHSIADYVRAVFLNPVTRPLLLVGDAAPATLADNAGATEFRETPFFTEHRRYSELVDFWHQGVRLQLGDFVEYKTGRKGGGRPAAPTAVRRIDALRYAPPADYLKGCNSQKDVTDLPSVRVRPVLQASGPGLVEKGARLRHTRGFVWFPVSSITKRVTPRLLKWETLADNTERVYIADPPSFGPPVVGDDALLIVVSVFIDGFGGASSTGDGCIQMAYRLEDLHSATRQSQVYDLTGFVTSHAVHHAGGPSGLLQFTCDEFNRHAPGAEAIRVLDCSDGFKAKDVYLMVGMHYADIPQGHETCGTMGGSALCSRMTYVTADDLPRIDAKLMLDHTRTRRAAATECAVGLMRVELGKPWQADAAEASVGFQEAVRQRFGLQHQVDKLSWTRALTAAHDVNVCSWYDPSHLLFENLFSGILRKHLAPAIQKEKTLGKTWADFRSRLADLVWPAGVPRPEFSVGDKQKLAESTSSWAFCQMLCLAMLLVGDMSIPGCRTATLTKPATTAACKFLWFKTLWVLTLRTWEPVSAAEVKLLQDEGLALIRKSYIIFPDGGPCPAYNMAGLCEYLVRQLPALRNGGMTSCQAFEGKNKVHKKAIRKGGHAAGGLAMKAARVSYVVRHVLQGGSWVDSMGVLHRLGRAFGDLSHPTVPGAVHPLLTVTMTGVGDALRHGADDDNKFVAAWGETVVWCLGGQEGGDVTAALTLVDPPDAAMQWRVRDRVLLTVRRSRALGSGRARLCKTLDLTKRDDPAVAALFAQAAAEAQWDPRLKSILEDPAHPPEVRLVKLLYRHDEAGRLELLRPGDDVMCWSWADSGEYTKGFAHLVQILEVVGRDGRYVLSYIGRTYSDFAHNKTGGRTQIPVDLGSESPVVFVEPANETYALPMRFVRGQVMVAHACDLVPTGKHKVCGSARRCVKHTEWVGPVRRHRDPPLVFGCDQCNYSPARIFHYCPPDVRVSSSGAGTIKTVKAAWENNLFRVLGREQGFRPGYLRQRIN